jgi:RNA polymerase sigma-70 factor (ECF subfamily)
MQAVAGGDLDSFEEIVLRYRQYAWRIAYRFLGDAMESEDVAQESFLKILEAAPRYRPTATFRTYFYRTLTRLCIDLTGRSGHDMKGRLQDVVPNRSIHCPVQSRNEQGMCWGPAF